MSQPFRAASGGRIDRATTIGFSFDGRRLIGHPGDTLASALLANGVHLVGRSFKYHRPRGILAAGAEEPNALVTVDRGGGRVTPNLRATQVELYEGLAATSQNRWPSLASDIGAVNDALSPLFPAGFYYKTFMGPSFIPKAELWKRLFEPVIRRAAGLGHAPKLADPDRYANLNAHCDVLVVGGGPAGLAAAQAAAASGARVILCDEQNEFGGSLLAEREASIERLPAADWVARTVAELAKNERVTLLPRTQAFGYFAQNFVALAERLTDHLAAPDPDMPRERMWQVRAKHVVLAAGAIERPLVFPDNDRPGIMLAGAARTFVERFAAKPGSRAVVAGAHDEIYRAALALERAGVEVALVADQRRDPEGALHDRARKSGLVIAPGTTIAGTTGRLRVASATTARLRSDGAILPGDTLRCDCLLMSGGLTPSVHLFSQSRGKLAWDAGRQMFVPGASAQAVVSAGACAGIMDLRGAIESGYVAGASAARAAGLPAPQPRQTTVENADAMQGGFAGEAPHGRDPARARAFVDFQNDVTAKDIRLATREGFRSIEHIKRYTTNGMATDQGKTSNINALAIAAAALGKSVPEVGLTTFRQPYTPVTFGLFAGQARGDLFDPVRRTPIHDWAAEHGAAFEDVGQWKRAHYFPRPGETMHRAVARECGTVRQNAGLFDATTLGKIEVVGPDAAEFLNRLYVNAFTKLEPGRCRYGLMLTEAGFVMDDGVIGRLAPDRFHVTTTTGGAARVLHHMEDYLQTEFTHLRVWLTSVTEQWAVIAVQGPRARDIIAPFVEGIALDGAAMPHMSLREGKLCGVAARLFRVSFTGELGFEVNVPADHGQAVWEALWAEGQKHGACAYGTETMHVLRAEKGYIIVGQETDGTVTPDDLGLGKAVVNAKSDFVGKRGLTMRDLAAPGRKQLVGLATRDGATVLEEGAQVTQDAAPPKGTPALGHVTSAYWSETLRRPIALALVANGRARLGETLQAPMPAGAIAVEVVEPVFYDQRGVRLDG